MNSNDFDFYEDDEGLSVNLVLNSFGRSEIPFTYLDVDSGDEIFVAGIKFVIENQSVLYELSKKEIALYIDKVYKSNDLSFYLVKIYVFPESDNEFGFMYRWSEDTEHGIGVKYSGLSVQRVGSAEVAFM